jgi:hypothetical protein
LCFEQPNKGKFITFDEKYVYTNDINEVDDDIEDFSLKTRAYWDCFRSYKFLILMKRDLSLRG